YVYMGHMRFSDIEPYEEGFWKKNRIDLVYDHVTDLDFIRRDVTTATGKIIAYTKLIIACGSVSNTLDIPGMDAKNVKGLYSIQDLQFIHQISKDIKKAVIVGGGLIGIELAEMLCSRNIPVTFLVRESAFSNTVLPAAEALMINDHIREHHVNLHLDTEPGVIIKNNESLAVGIKTKNEKIFDCDFIGLTVGVHPNVVWLKNTGLAINKGIIADQFLRTNVENVFAIGDCAELKQPPPGRKPIEAIWYAGRMMGECVAYTVCGYPTPYDPGIWFNSAKFFDIEYQVYGDIQPTLPQHQNTFFWQHPGKKKSVRINFEKHGAVVGFNLLGVRFRQEVCEKWISGKYPIQDVMQNLQLAFFDPEFSANDCALIQTQYQVETNQSVQLQKKINYNPVHQFLTSQIMRST
ncbi:MAG: NAD(P)/FAD-dependent oxidoreductase, partial [Saprospiraceae bacterium]